MAIVVLLLRLIHLLLNVYDTFKTLKYPPPSARNGGRPNVRAMTVRKRELKGCLAVWIVWCYLAAYERLFEGFISILVPFYDEFKSIALLFLIFTRARGAEPIYLHIIRPFLKPYTPTIDLTLDFLRLIGDMLFATVKLPLRWWYGTEDTDSDARSEYGLHAGESAFSGTDVPRPYPTYPRTNHNLVSSSAPSLLPPGIQAQYRSVSAGNGSFWPAEVMPRHFSDEAARTLAQQQQQRRSVLEDASDNAIPPSLRPGHGSHPTKSYEFWQPPPSAYDDDSAHEQAIVELHQVPNPNDSMEIEQLEEWRRYPPFPSAYPNTPIARRSRALPDQQRHSQPPIVEENETSSDLTSEQGFHLSLSQVSQPSTPDWTDGASDETATTATLQASGVGSLKDAAYPDGNRMAADKDHDADPMAEDEDEEEEDAFNVTLRTPLPPTRYGPPSITLRQKPLSGYSMREGSLHTTLRPPQGSSHPLVLRSEYDPSSSPSVSGKKRQRSDSLSRETDEEDQEPFQEQPKPPSPPAQQLKRATKVNTSREPPRVRASEDDASTTATSEDSDTSGHKDSEEDAGKATRRSQRSVEASHPLKRRRVAASTSKEGPSDKTAVPSRPASASSSTKGLPRSKGAGTASVSSVSIAPRTRSTQTQKSRARTGSTQADKRSLMSESENSKTVSRTRSGGKR